MIAAILSALLCVMFGVLAVKNFKKRAYGIWESQAFCSFLLLIITIIHLSKL